MTTFLHRIMIGIVLGGQLAASAGPARAQETTRLTVGSITGPMSNPIIWNLLKSQRFDIKHGLSLEMKLYPSIVTFYDGFAAGEVDSIMGGPTNLLKLRQQGVLLKIIATGLKLSDLVIFTRDPEIRTFEDLKGKRLAIDTGGSQYQVMSIYARHKGINLGTDVALVNANVALARAQLMSGNVDAAMIAEPLATATALDNPALRPILNGNDAWRDLTGQDGWETVIAIRDEALKRSPAMPDQLIAAVQDTVAFANSHPDEADRIIVDSIKLRPGIFKESLLKKRIWFDVQPAWGDQQARIMDLMQRAVAAGFIAQAPDEAIIYAR
jgi:ABC-type nitrate/sulfonate/bicarbonate transport system substrate-binding protein